MGFDKGIVTCIYYYIPVQSRFTRIKIPSCFVVAHISVTELVLRLLKSMEIDKRPEKKLRQGFTGTHAASGGNKTSNRFFCSLLE